MTEHDGHDGRDGRDDDHGRDDGDDRTWFRRAVDPVLDAHRITDRWDDLRARVEERPPLVVALVPPRSARGRRTRLLAAAAAVVVAALVGVGVLVATSGDGPSSPQAAPPVTPTSRGPVSTGTTTSTTTTTTVPPGPLVTVPAVQRRIDLSDMGLDVRYLDRADEEVAEGAVVSQDPAPGTSVPEGSLVVVVMSGGGPVMEWADLPPEARAFTDELEGYQRPEPIRRVPTDVGEAYKTDAWLFGPCPAVDLAAPTILDPTYDARCY